MSEMMMLFLAYDDVCSNLITKLLTLVASVTLRIRSNPNFL